MARDTETTPVATATGKHKGAPAYTAALLERNWQFAFLDHLRRTHNISHAAHATGIARQTVYDALETSPGFAELVEEAKDQAVGGVEASLFERAVKHDTPAALAILKAKLPDEYDRARRTEVDIQVSGVVAHLRTSYTLEEMAALRDELQTREEARALPPGEPTGSE